MFPFGHGLGYTSFDISKIEASETSGGITVDVTLKNTGTRKGSTVVQLYVSDTEASVSRPEKELKGFQKISLAAGEEATVSIDLNPRDFAFFDVDAGVWRVEAGEFTLSAGFSAADLKVSTVVTCKAEEISK